MENTSNQLLAFKIGNIGFALKIERVVSVEKAVKVTHVPDNTPAIKGIVALQGEMFRFVDLSYIFFNKPTAVNINQKMIFIRESSKKWVIAADEILGFTAQVSEVSSVSIEFEVLKNNKMKQFPTIESEFGPLVFLREIVSESL